MTKQETFDAIVRGIVAQGRPSWDSSTSMCRYRFVLNDGTVLKCAAGQVIPDDQYDPQIEGVGLITNKTFCEDAVGAVSGIPTSAFETVHRIISEGGHDLNLVGDLQRLHDRRAELNADIFISKFVTGACQVAKKHGLSTEVLDRCGVTIRTI